MSFFRKRQPSQTQATGLPPQAGAQQAQQTSNGIPGPSEVLKREQQQTQQGLNHRLPDDRSQPPARPPPPTTSISNQASAAGPTPPQQPQRPRSSYPWTARPLQLTPPSLIPRPGMSVPTQPSPSPFPRYGHSLPLTATASGELFIFGGLVKETVKDDLYSFSTNDVSCSMVQTTGDVPSPRVGHASAVLSSVLIVWGGDTKVVETDKQDNALYLLNLGSRQWTRVDPEGPAPVGRYGHAVTMCGTKFYIYGGQVDGEFLDDLWCFDLSSLKDGRPRWENLSSPPHTKAPARRTGHVMVTYADKLYLFGGTDGQFHYNDTWCYDTSIVITPTTSAWSDLQCIGYIPLPREGHAGALVDDVMYIFGGRGVDGKDLSDLAAFKISNRRWYMFQNMGPAPSGRSGHSMASAGSKVFVIGGESSTVSKPDDPGIVHVLETKNIRYPDSSRSANPPTQQTSNGTPTTQQPSNSQRPSPTTGSTPGVGPIPTRALSPQGQAYGGSDSEDVRRNLAGSPSGGRPGQNQPMQPFPTSNPSPNQNQNPTRVRSPVQQPPRVARFEDADRDRSEDDEVVLTERSTSAAAISREGAMSPTSQNGGSQNQLLSRNARSPTPTNMNPNPSRAISPTTNGPSQQPAPVQTLTNRLAARSPSPVVSTPPPGDAFHYGGNSANVNGAHRPAPTPPVGARAPSAASHINHVASSSSLSIHGSPSIELMRDLRARDAELESSRRRETWMRVALLKARSQGFVWGDQDLGESLRDPSTPINEIEEDELESDKIQDSILKLKQDYARLENEMAQHARALSERYSEADRVRTAALQEATFYRAKLSALEAGSLDDASRLERDRSVALERLLASAANDRQSQDRRIAELTDALTTQTRLREQADEQSSAVAKRAEQAEANYSTLSRVHEDLQERHTTAQTTLRDHGSKLSSLTSLVQQREAEHSQIRSQVETLTLSKDQQMRTYEQLQEALSSAAARADEAESQLRSSRDRVAQLEADQVELRNEIETRAHEAEAATARVAEAEDAWAKSREEADKLRALATGGLGELLDLHREAKAGEDQSVSGQTERITALEDELASVRQLLKESETQITSSQSDLASHRRKLRDLTSDHQTLKVQLAGVRSQLSEHVTSTGQLRKEIADRDARLQDVNRSASESELRLGALRDHLAESGITVDIDELIAGGSSPNNGQSTSVTAHLSRIRELESLLAVKTQQIEDFEKRRENDLTSNRSGSALGHADATLRAEAAERQLAEAKALHKEQLARLDDEYKTAVHYVNKTDKLMRRLKEEHARQKGVNTSLQAELDSLRSGSEASPRTRIVNGRMTPLSDDSHDGPSRSQFQELQRQLQRANAESAELQKKVANMETEVDSMREALNSARREVDLRVQQIEELEADIDRLDAALEAARNETNASLSDKLQEENLELKRENDLLQQRIGLLLDMDQPANSRSNHRLSGRPDSRASSIKDHQFDALSNELDDWLAASGSSRRPISTYESLGVRGTRA